MTAAQPKYWFARYRPVAREDFGFRSSETPNQDLMRDRFMPFNFAWRLQYSRPVSRRGWMVVWIGACGFLVSILILGAEVSAGTGFPIWFVGWTALLLVGLLAMVSGRTDPAKFVEDYDRERDAKIWASGRAPWLRPPGEGK